MTNEEILKTEWNESIDTLCKNRMIQGFYSYGPRAINYGEKLVKALDQAKASISAYEETKNPEKLLDAINFLRIEFDYPSIDGTKFKETTDRSIKKMTYRDIEQIGNMDVMK